MDIQIIAEKINALSKNYKISNLQKIRKKNKSLYQIRTSKIFSKSTIFIEQGYAFHDGGRTEIQYNIGLDEEDRFRYGLGLSLEPGQTLPDISIMYPKIRKFNYLLRYNPSLFSGYKMFAIVDGEWRETKIIHEIESSIVKSGTFIFFGEFMDIKNINYDKILETFDKMLPIYENIESIEQTEIIQEENVNNKFSFEKTNVSLPHSKVYTSKQLEIEIDIRHTKIQEKLVTELYKEYGKNNVSLEHPIYGYSVDVVVNNNGQLIFYEIKTAQTARDCIRQALGQILDYAYWPGQKNAEKLVIVGENQIDGKTQKYLDYLNNIFGNTLIYLQIKL
ncbi:MAG: hypothetical protein FWD91_00465 [Treponema sp.]|nr:hypothetical protein [Treponema sp.]